MKGLVESVPDQEALLALEPEELGLIMVDLAQRAREARYWLMGFDQLFDSTAGKSYPSAARRQIELAVSEAWAWLKAEGLFVPEPGPNGMNGYVVLSRRGSALSDEAMRRDFRTARLLPRELLHPSIRDVTWHAFLRGEYDVAVFQAMKEVEVAVRAAAGLGAEVVGVKLMREAFHPTNGPLTDPNADGGEREARMALFAGAIGSYKNPLSHRHVTAIDAAEAVEQVLLASHLLRIVSARAQP